MMALLPVRYGAPCLGSRVRGGGRLPVGSEMVVFSPSDAGKS